MILQKKLPRKRIEKDIPGQERPAFYTLPFLAANVGVRSGYIDPSEYIRIFGRLGRSEGLEHGGERVDETRVARDFGVVKRLSSVCVS